MRRRRSGWSPSPGPTSGVSRWCPKAVASLVNSGVAVVVESGAGEGALLPDELYTEAGATIGDAWAADIVVKVAPPTADEVGRLHSGQTLIGFLAPRNADNSIGALNAGRCAGVRARGHPANIAGPGDGCVVVAGQRGRLQGGAAGGLGVDPVLPDADHGGRNGEAGHRAGARRRAWPGCRRWRRPNGWARAPPATTCVPRWPTRSARWGRSGWTSASTRPVRVGTPASSPRRNAPSSRRRWKKRSAGSTW